MHLEQGVTEYTQYSHASLEALQRSETCQADQVNQQISRGAAYALLAVAAAISSHQGPVPGAPDR